MSSFPFCMHFFPFLVLLYDKTFKTILNRSGKRRHPYLVSDLRDKASNFPTLNIIFTEIFYRLENFKNDSQLIL